MEAITPHMEIRAELLNSGQKCRLCEVIVQRTSGGTLKNGMELHKIVVHSIGKSAGE